MDTPEVPLEIESLEIRAGSRKLRGDWTVVIEYPGVLAGGDTPERSRPVHRLRQLRHGQQVFVERYDGEYTPARVVRQFMQDPYLEDADNEYLLAQSKHVTVLSTHNKQALKELQKILELED
jgi:hypothetical protein